MVLSEQDFYSRLLRSGIEIVRMQVSKFQLLVDESYEC